MILLCDDEDIGRGIPHASSDVGYCTISVEQQGWIGRLDIELLAISGKEGWLFLSANKKMLQVPYERDAIVENNVGVVFLTNEEERIVKVLWLLLLNWDALDLLDRTEVRPFVCFLNIRRQLLNEYRKLKL